MLGFFVSLLDKVSLRRCLFFHASKLSFFYAIRLYFSVSVSLESQPCILTNCGQPECINSKARTGAKSHPHSRPGARVRARGASSIGPKLVQIC